MEAIQKVLPYQEVKDQLEVEKKHFVTNFYNIAKLVTRVYNEKLYEYWGFGAFKDFVLENLDINLAIAYRMVTLVNGQHLLEIPTNELLQIKSTNLLEIFSLNPEHNADEIKTLLEDAKTDTVETIKNKVRKVKGLDGVTWFKFSYTDDSTVEFIKKGFEQVKQDFGDTINPTTGEATEISNSRVLELLVAEYMAK